MKCALIIFVKNPIKGKVKTRLAVSIGDEAALKVYNKLTDYTRTVTMQLNVDLYLYYSLTIDNNDKWPEDRFNKQLQAKGDLGDRMYHALKEVLETHDTVVLIGSDCPEINTDIFESAFSALDQVDYCLGPSHDGGYYLIGAKKIDKSIFDNMKWSTDSVLEDTLHNINTLNKGYHLLPTLHDLDNIEDLERFPDFIPE